MASMAWNPPPHSTGEHTEKSPLQASKGFPLRSGRTPLLGLGEGIVVPHEPQCSSQEPEPGGTAHSRRVCRLAGSLILSAGWVF